MTKPGEPILDLRARPLGVLRLSLTARCNLACPYCCPDPHDPQGLLTLPQQLRLIRAACLLGAHTLRITGGEPLLSDRLVPLLEAIDVGRGTAGDPLQSLEEIALTSNGVLLDPQRARRLRSAGLTRITISLDGADGGSVARMAGLQGGAVAGERLLTRVISGLNAAAMAGFDPDVGELKLNTVLQRGVNDDQLIPLADLARHHGVELRFIEYMDVGNRNGWRRDRVVPAADIVRCLEGCWPLEPLQRVEGRTARRWRYRDGGGIVGVIASISEPFCQDCNRLRVTADGKAFTCLFASKGKDLRPWLQADSSEEALIVAMVGLWSRRLDRFSEERQALPLGAAHAEMAYLGG